MVERRDPREAAGPEGKALERVRWRVVPPLAAALALGLLAFILLREAARPIALLILAVALAEALSPIVDWLARRLGSRTAAVTLVYLVLAALVGLLVWAVVPPLVAQTQQLVAQLPALAEGVRSTLEQTPWRDQIHLQPIVSKLVSLLGGFALSVPTRIFSAGVDALVVVFLSVYWLIGSHHIAAFTLSLLPAESRDRYADVAAEAGQAMGGYVRGVAINSAIMGVLSWFGLMLIGVLYPVPLGVLTAMGEAVPVVGPIVVGAIVAMLALTQSLTKALIALAFFTGLTQLEGHVLTPNIMHRQTEIPQTLVLFAIIVGAALGGVLGILVSIPIAAATRVLVVRLVPRETTSEQVEARRARKRRAESVGAE